MNAGMSCCPRCEKPLFPGNNFCGGCGAVVDAPISRCPENAVFTDDEASVQVAAAGEQTLIEIANYERVAAILWICLGVIQVFTLVTIIAGIWNIYAACTRLKLPDQIRARNPGIPAMYEKQIPQLLIIGALNLVLGGVIGVAFVVFDFVIRGMVLRHRDLFVGERPSPQRA